MQKKNHVPSPYSAKAVQTASSVAEKGKLPTKRVVVGGPERVSLKTFLGLSPKAAPSRGGRGRERSTYFGKGRHYSTERKINQGREMELTLTGRPSISFPANSKAFLAAATVVNST